MDIFKEIAFKKYIEYEDCIVRNHGDFLQDPHLLSMINNQIKF